MFNLLACSFYHNFITEVSFS